MAAEEEKEGADIDIRTFQLELLIGLARDMTPVIEASRHGDLLDLVSDLFPDTPMTDAKRLRGLHFVLREVLTAARDSLPLSAQSKRRIRKAKKIKEQINTCVMGAGELLGLCDGEDEAVLKQRCTPAEFEALQSREFDLGPLQYRQMRAAYWYGATSSVTGQRHTEEFVKAAFRAVEDYLSSSLGRERLWRFLNLQHPTPMVDTKPSRQPMVPPVISSNSLTLAHRDVANCDLEALPIHPSAYYSGNQVLSIQASASYNGSRAVVLAVLWQEEYWWKFAVLNLLFMLYLMINLMNVFKANLFSEYSDEWESIRDDMKDYGAMLALWFIAMLLWWARYMPSTNGRPTNSEIQLREVLGDLQNAWSFSSQDIEWLIGSLGAFNGTQMLSNHPGGYDCRPFFRSLEGEHGRRILQQLKAIVWEPCNCVTVELALCSCPLTRDLEERIEMLTNRLSRDWFSAAAATAAADQGLPVQLPLTEFLDIIKLKREQV